MVEVELFILVIHTQKPKVSVCFQTTGVIFKNWLIKNSKKRRNLETFVKIV